MENHRALMCLKLEYFLILLSLFKYVFLLINTIEIFVDCDSVIPTY